MVSPRSLRRNRVGQSYRKWRSVMNGEPWIVKAETGRTRVSKTEECYER